MTEAKPLSADEVGAYLFHVEKLGTDYDKEMVWRLKATIEQQREQIEKLRAALTTAKIPHLTCEDSWYSCPECEEGCSSGDTGCNCGAEKHNKDIDEALAATEPVNDKR